MKIFSFFKKQKETPPEIEKIPRESLTEWFKSKKQETLKQRENYFSEIKNIVLDLTNELNNKKETLKQVDFEKIKEKQRIKLIVRENLNNYRRYIEDLIKKLKEVNEKEDIIEQINKTFSEFKKRSKISYEKATYLIGKEIADINNSIAVFFKKTEEIIKNNKEITENYQVLQSIESDLNSINETKNAVSSVRSKINEQDLDIQKKEKEIKRLQKEIKDLKESEEFLSLEKQKQKLKEKKNELNKLITELYHIIDFKTLTNFYHKYEKDMIIIKEFKENFKTAFHSSDKENFKALLKESKTENQNIENFFRRINEKQNEINNIRIKDIGVEKLDSLLNNLNLELENKKQEIENENKKLEKLKTSLNNLFETIKDRLLTINIELN